MHRAWSGEAIPGAARPVTPRPRNGHAVPLMFGGWSERTVQRVVRYGIGYTLGGGNPEALTGMMERINTAWRQAGRGGRPQFRALSYVALGDGVAADAEANILDYHGDFGPRIWAAAIKTAAQAQERVRLFAATGCDELIIVLTVPAVEQVERLADAVF